MSEASRIAFIDSWPDDAARGSGTAVGIRALRAGLEARGERIVTLAPRGRRGSAWPGRIRFNLALGRRADLGRYELIVGFDLDGFAVSGRTLPYVVCLKGVIADEARFEHVWRRPALRLLARLERRNARGAERVIVPSEYSRARVAALYGIDPVRIAVVPEPIDLASWSMPGDVAPLADRPPTILSVARQYPRKNTRALIAALPRIRARIPQARLRIVGGGPELPTLRALVRRLGLGDAVDLLGALPDDRSVRAEFARAALFALPSRQEGFGIVFLEAMAAGLPVVAANAGAVPEVVADGVVGHLVAPDDADGLADAVAGLLEDRARATRMGDAGRARVRRYALPAVIASFEAAVATVRLPPGRPRDAVPRPV